MQIPTTQNYPPSPKITDIIFAEPTSLIFLDGPIKMIFLCNVHIMLWYLWWYLCVMCCALVRPNIPNWMMLCDWVCWIIKSQPEDTVKTWHLKIDVFGLMSLDLAQGSPRSYTTGTTRSDLIAIFTGDADDVPESALRGPVTVTVAATAEALESWSSPGTSPAQGRLIIWLG